MKIRHADPMISLTETIFRPPGKESTEVRKSQIMGKESENSYQELKRSQTNRHTQTLYRDISTGMAVFLNRKRVNVCEHTTKTVSLESLRKVYLDTVSVCLCVPVVL